MAIEANTIALLSLAVLQLVNGILAQIRGKHAEKATEEVKATLADNNSVQVGRLDSIHKLVNSEYATALRTGAAALERIAAITKDSGDIEQAKTARKLSNDHDQKQIR